MLSEKMEDIYMQHDADTDNNTPTEGLFILNADGNFVHLNEKALSFAGERHGTLIGKHFSSIAPEKERRKIHYTLGELFKGRSTRYTIPKYDYGIKHIFEVNINPVIQNRKIIMFVGTIRDITHIRKMEADRKKAISREKMFRESVAHHFFNPIVIARGYLQLVMEGTCNNDEREKLEAVKTAVGRIESVVKNVIRDGDIRE